MDSQTGPKIPNPDDFFAKVETGPAKPEAQEVQAELKVEPTAKVTPPLVGVSRPGVFPTTPSAPTSPSPAATAPKIPEDFLPASENPKRKLLLVAGFLIVLAVVLLVFKTLFAKIGKKDKEVSLVYWGLWEPESVMSSIIADYQKDHPKVKISFVPHLGESAQRYRERLSAALATGESPDIFRFHNTWVPMLKEHLSPVPASVMDSATFERLYYPVVRSDLRVANGYVGLPLMMDTLALFYNEEIFQTAGKVPPKTWDELRKTAAELTVRDVTGKIQTAGVALGVTNNIDHWSEILGLMLLQNGASLANPADPKLAQLASDAILYYTTFYGRDRVWDVSLPSSTYYFASGRLAMYFGPSWRVFEIKALNPSLKFKVISFPQFPGATESWVTWATYWVEGVSKKSLNQEAAWEFLKYLSSKEVMEKLYQAESQLRLFGEPYARTDMADLLKKEPLVGVFIEQAAMAKSWYLCSRTFDNGINDKIIKYYEDAINAVNKGANPQTVLATIGNGVTQVLSQYGVK